ncbi:alpha-galactosidase [Parasphaerochaeta coccoides]|uniref:Alpha-galactosidase n=1 Tax=Parasphaerochaeta coccoides (strain ATCC BAA-1237 / DSM 17374 / SPN1) TaxID=760011 RepID=F4GLM3_PARC1|nr:alpha-galactosidase [Parasphaerochaeta coccoides]AEC02417.1 Alpha-galactosidase [Parasphaerochaeta coccoides DSM 17374]
MKKTRICIIGGGSRLWAIQFMKDLAYNTTTHGSLVLYDIDKAAARNNVAVARQVFSVNKSEGRFQVEACDEIGEALSGCDLVVISIEPGKTECRYGDLVLPEEYGILQSVGDTTGPGGIMRARRALPIFFDFARQIEKYCPDAWVINYTNPMTLCTAALYHAFPGIKALGCCHEVFHTQNFLADGVSRWFSVPRPDRRDIKIDITGVNHFTFLTKATWQGNDLMPHLLELVSNPAIFTNRTAQALQRLKDEKWFDCDQIIGLSFFRDFGALGAAGDRHLAEFVPWFLTSDEDLHHYGVIRTPYDWRLRSAKEKREKVFKDDELVAELSDEEGVDIMRSLMGERTMVTNINFPNEGQINYLPVGRIVESNGVISQDSIRPLVSSAPPLAVQNLVRQVSDVQQMTLDAVVSGDDGLLFSAFLCDPLVNISRDKARELFDRMLKASALQY